MKNSPQRHCRHFEIKAYGWASGIPTFFMTQFVRYVKHALTKDGVVPSWDHRMMEIFNTQNSIGPTMLVQGFIATAWVRLLMDMGWLTPNAKWLFWSEHYGMRWLCQYGRLETIFYTTTPISPQISHTHNWGIDYFGTYNIRINCPGRINSWGNIQPPVSS